MAFLTDDFKTHMAKQFVESFDESANTIYYMFAAKTSAYEDENVIPDPSGAITAGYYALFEDMIFAKHITPNDVSMLIRNVPWETGQTYAMYDDKDEELQTKNFFVISQEPGNIYSIFKCVNNNSVTRDGETYIPPTFDQPLSSETSATDEYYRTADGYVWKLMTTLTRTQYEKYVTQTHAPVTINLPIVAAATAGALDTIVVESGGSRYNSYAFGSVKEAGVAGDLKIFSLQTDTTLDIMTFDVQNETGTFIASHSLGVPKKVFFEKSDGTQWTVSSNVYDVKATVLRVLLTSNSRYPNNITKVFQTSTNLIGGAVTAKGTIIDIRRDLIPALSSNTDFYKNNSFYIRSGRGAGQVRNITEYIVTGNERRILIDDDFTILPDNTSRFEIGPRVIISGDGTSSDGTGNAKAIVNLDPAGNTVSSIEMVDTGRNYTYADVLIQGNTGFVDVTTQEPINADSAVARAIIPPPGGHGADIMSELGSHSVGVSIKFNGSEGGLLPTQNDYRTVGILSEPRLANTEFTIATNSLFFADGETITQPSNGATAEVSNRNGTTLRVRNIRGFFESGKEITTVRTNNNVTSIINTIDRQAEILDQRTKFSVVVTNTGPQGTGFIRDELVTQEVTGATGIVYSVTSNRVDLVAVRGIWNVSDTTSGTVAEMTGKTSGAVATINAKTEGDITPNVGKFFYIENFAPIARANNQVEDIKLTLEF